MLVSKHRPRHNRGVRVVCALLAVMALTSVAYAHPVDLERFDDRDFVRGRKPRPKPERIPTPEEMCERNKSWAKLVKCLSKGGNTVKTLYDLGKGRLIAVQGNPSYDSAAVYLYTQQGARWQRMGGYFATNPTTEILSFARLKNENGYRLEQGQIFKSSALTGERFPGADQTRVPVTLRRKTTSICLDNGYCQTIISSCDALVDGKTRWSFHGTVLIDHGQVRVKGDRSFAGQVCAPSPSQLSDVGDVLE
jgi:hypothetical protein